MANESDGRLVPMLNFLARGGLAGLLSGLLTVGVSELYAGIFGGLPSLLVSMSGRIVDLSPRAMEEFAISVFGTSDKLALVIFLVVLSGLFGATLGVVALRSRPAAVAGFAAFGILAGLANAFDAQSTPAHAAAAAAFRWRRRWRRSCCSSARPGSRRVPLRRRRPYRCSDSDGSFLAQPRWLRRPQPLAVSWDAI